ncbi:hypothetical protein ACXR0O_01125 [Verrucomicrobiota bacterium sgz303538]
MNILDQYDAKFIAKITDRKQRAAIINGLRRQRNGIGLCMFAMLGLAIYGIFLGGPGAGILLGIAALTGVQLTQVQSCLLTALLAERLDVMAAGADPDRRLTSGTEPAAPHNA